MKVFIWLAYGLIIGFVLGVAIYLILRKSPPVKISSALVNKLDQEQTTKIIKDIFLTNPSFKKCEIDFVQEDNVFVFFIRDKKRSIPLFAMIIYKAVINGRPEIKVELKSNLGFCLKNIPINEEGVLRECAEIFWTAERLLPRAYLLLLNNGFQAKEIKDVCFIFPDFPLINLKNNRTYFIAENGIPVVGLAISANEAIVTLEEKDDLEVTLIHEYVHLCGYRHQLGNKQVEKDFQKALNCALQAVIIK
jgi:hypothetical protein